MPALLRKLTICAAVDGLILQPYNHGSSPRHNGPSEPSAIRIDYKTNKISSLSPSAADRTERSDPGLEAYGLVGLLSIASFSFLIAITQREQVADIQGKPVYAITDVTLVPVSSREDADRVIAQANRSLHRDGSDSDSESDSDSKLGDACDDIPQSEGDGIETETGSAPVSPTSPSRPRESSLSGSIAEDVIGRRMRFGRFAANWLSRRRLGLSGFGTMDQDTAGIPLGDMTAIAEGDKSFADADIPVADWGITESTVDGAGEQEEKMSEQTVELMPKLLRYTRLLFASQNFFFSYDYDLSRQVTAQEPRGNYLPLHKMADPLYFWNRNLMAPFIDADAHPFVLPLVQGFVGQREFTVSAPGEPAPGTPPEECPEAHILGEKNENQAVDPGVRERNFLLTLISRRSVQRPGLRYLRRGVDDDGNAANSVETEQILSAPDWDPSHNVYSYLQVRGSIPLYFSQSPYSLKPVPVLHRSAETNKLAFERHFRCLSRRYGKIQAVSLIDKQGGEMKMGDEYDKYMKALNEEEGVDGTPINLEWFDFHNECRGMKFENVSRLVNRLQGTLEGFGDTVLQDGHVVKSQKGVMRTNCMDCLDRTGVAQCAFGQWALEHELKHEGIDIDLSGHSATQWFNTLWADNGDAISKQYSSTAALKGDYTRTRKRNYRGALSDFGLTLSRYFNNIVSDYFSQACIDYLLGNVTTHIFDEFAVEMQSADPGISVQKLRQNAIDTSSRIVISEQSEEFLGGWTMLTPRQPNTLRTLPFEECVLLLTDATVYSCHFDWDTDNVTSFERIPLRSISRLTLGTYITSALAESQTDPATNVGLVIVYRAGDGDSGGRRVNTRSLQSQVDPSELDEGAPSSEWGVYSWFTRSKQPSPRFMAFKALPLSNSVTQRRNSTPPAINERAFVRTVCEDIERAMTAGEGRSVGGSSLIEEADIISLREAKKRTGYLETLVYDIKKLVWA